MIQSKKNELQKKRIAEYNQGTVVSGRATFEAQNKPFTGG